tara:strand:+ start:254 stop:1363 length:1110 start_codon:yes stop_codon:yes gene_type:complete
MPYLGNTPSTSFATVVKDTFNGGSTAYTLSKVATTNSVSVFVENVRQEPTTAYAVSGTTLTFTATTPSGTGNIYVLHMNPTTTTTHPAAQNLTAVDGTFTGAFTSVGIDDNADATAITIDSSEKVGIGTASPQDPLHTYLASGQRVARFEANDSTSAHIAFKASNTSLMPTVGVKDEDLYFSTGDAVERARFDADSNGDLILQTGNLVIGTGGKGIDFTNATNDSEMTSELLDDYEEGLATMSFVVGAGSITMNTSYSKLAYTKIGRMVQINGQVASSAVSGIGTGNYLQIDGLPFAAADLDHGAGRCGFHVPHDSANMVDGREIFGFVNESGAVINIYEQNLNGASNKAEIMDSNASLYFSFTYNTTS